SRDWGSDLCSSDLQVAAARHRRCLAAAGRYSPTDCSNLLLGVAQIYRSTDNLSNARYRLWYQLRRTHPTVGFNLHLRNLLVSTCLLNAHCQKNASNFAEKFARGKWFADYYTVAKGTGRPQDLGTWIFCAVARHKQHRQAGCDLRNPARQFQAAHLRHIDIRQQQIDPVVSSLKKHQRLPGIGGDQDIYVRNTNRNWLTLLARSDEKVEEAGCCIARRRANL